MIIKVKISLHRSLALVSTGGVSHDNGWGDGPSPPVTSMLDGEGKSM